MICPQCGNNCAKNDRFCARCGKALSRDTEKTAAEMIMCKITAQPTAVWICIAAAVVALCAAVICLTALHRGTAAAVPIAPTAAATDAPTAVPTSTPTAEPTAAPTAVPVGPNVSDLGRNEAEEEPRADSWLPDYGKTRYVLASAGECIYLVPEPRKSGHIDTVNDDVKVTVLAEQDGYALIKTPDGRVGWVNGKYLVTDSERISRIPDLDGTYWRYHDGDDLYQCRIIGKTLYACNAETGEYLEKTIAVSGRRLKGFGVHFVWNGTYFAGGSGKYLERDPDEMYDYTPVSPDADDDSGEEILWNWNAMTGDITAYEVVDGDEYIWITDCYTGNQCYLMIDSSCTVYDRYAYTATYRHEDMLVNTYDTLQPLIDLYGLPLLCIDLLYRPDNNHVMWMEKGYIGSSS